MKDELDQQLCQKYPKIFVDRFGDPKETLMCWGFECGDGWYKILDSLCGAIQHYIDWNNDTRELLLRDNPNNVTVPEEIPQVVAVQIKEKFGGLRFYYNGGDDRIYGMVRMAEAWADNTCEVCGEAGTTRSGGWVKTLCDKHEEERQARYAERFKN
jgi:hypothetical protein